MLRLISVLLFALPLHAADQEHPFRPGHGDRRGNENSPAVTSLRVGAPQYAGNACPPGTMRAVFAPDGLSFTLLFDQFVASLPTDAHARHDQMRCGALLPMQIPSGMQMEITRVDFRGFVGLPGAARAALHSIFNFRGVNGDHDRINLRYTFQGPVMDNYELTSDVLHSVGEAPVSEISPCGGPTRLWIMTQLQLTSPTSAQASVTLDSVDGSSHAVYYVNWRRCQN